MGRAASSTDGAITASMNVETMACAVSVSSGRGRVQVEQVRVGQILALEDRRVAEPTRAAGSNRAIPRRLLMRILAVPQVANLLERRIQTMVERTLEAVADQVDRRQRFADRGVVRPSVGERLAHQAVAEIEARRRVQLAQQPRVVAGIHDDEHVAEILRRRPHHARTADVDLLHEIVERHTRRPRRLLERIQVDDDDVDEADAVRARGLEVRGMIASREQTAVNERMQRLHAAVHHLGKSRDVGDAGDGQSRGGQRFRGAAGRHELEPAGGETAAELHDSGLVRNTQKGSRHKAFSVRIPRSDG